MERNTFREAFKSHSRRVDLRELAKTKRVGRVTSFETLERLLVSAIENIVFHGSWDPVLDRSQLSELASTELRKLLGNEEIHDLDHALVAPRQRG